MVRLIVRVVGTNPETGLEAVFSAIESDRYDPDHLETQIREALARSLTVVNGVDLGSLRFSLPEVSVVLTSDEETVRPSLHLSTETLQQLTEAGASFDFDPYV